MSAWYNNYHQYHNIINRLKIEKNFKRWEKSYFYFKNYKPEIVYSEGPYPFNLLGIIQRSPNLKFSDSFKSTKGMLEMIYFKYETVYERFDKYSFHDWAVKYNIDQKIYDIIFKPGLSITFNEAEKMSAAEMLTLIHMYFLSDSKADHRHVTRINSYDAVLKPWMQHLLKFGARIITEKSVDELKVDENDLSVYGSNDDEQKYDHVVIASDYQSTKNILRNTLKKYQNNQKIKLALEAILEKSLDKLHLSPSYKVSLIAS